MLSQGMNISYHQKLKKYIVISVHTISAIYLGSLSIKAIHLNQLGQNIINFSACILLLARFDNILIWYRTYINDSYIQNQATIILIFLYVFGNLIQKFSPTIATPSKQKLNLFCAYLLLITISLNILYYILITITLFIYMIRQVYKLMTNTLLSPYTNFIDNQLDQLKNITKPYFEHLQLNAEINEQCVICITQFKNEQMSILLPECKHVFHEQCLLEWLRKQKTTCPFCRSSIRLGLLMI